jgi:hypothetical protein
MSMTRDEYIMSNENYSNEMKGVLFNNIDKKRKESDRDYSGSCEIDGVEYWISSWINTPKSGGKKYMSLRFTKKDEQSGSTDKPPTPLATDEDIPF